MAYCPVCFYYKEFKLALVLMLVPNQICTSSAAKLAETVYLRPHVKSI
jgi:hypothetical protein